MNIFPVLLYCVPYVSKPGNPIAASPAGNKLRPALVLNLKRMNYYQVIYSICCLLSITGDVINKIYISGKWDNDRGFRIG
jgi:hypothetical protein